MFNPSFVYQVEKLLNIFTDSIELSNELIRLGGAPIPDYQTDKDVNYYTNIMNYISLVI